MHVTPRRRHPGSYHAQNSKPYRFYAAFNTILLPMIADPRQLQEISDHVFDLDDSHTTNVGMYKKTTSDDSEYNQWHSKVYPRGWVDWMKWTKFVVKATGGQRGGPRWFLPVMYAVLNRYDKTFYQRQPYTGVDCVSFTAVIFVWLQPWSDYEPVNMLIEGNERRGREATSRL